jgi:hypothetical protein
MGPDRLTAGRHVMGCAVGIETAEGAFDLGRAIRKAAHAKLRADAYCVTPYAVGLQVYKENNDSNWN